MTRACLGLVVLSLVAACGAPPPLARVVVANQQPVALLTLPGEAAAGMECAFDASASLDVDGRLVSWSLSFGDGTPPEVLAEGSTPSWQHQYQSAGRFVVQLEVTDDGGLIGRARLPLEVAPPPDSGLPTLDALEPTQNGAPLAEGARVAAGSTLDVTVRASDAEGNLESALVELGDAAASVDVAAGGGASGGGAAALVVPAMTGAAVLRASALDRYGNRSAPREHALLVIDAASDSDGDGLPDLIDPAPDVENGLMAEAFLLDALFDDGSIPTDLFGNQRAERVLEALYEATPAASAPRPEGWLTHAPGAIALETLVPGAPAAPTGFVARFSGFLEPPPNADAVVIEIEADDLGVVLLDGEVVASADEEYASDFFRFDRAPSRTDELAIDGRTPVVIVVGDGPEAPCSWSVRFDFLANGQSILVPEAVGISSFTVR